MDDLVRVAIAETDDLVTAGWGELFEASPAGHYRVTTGAPGEHPDVTLYGVRRPDPASPHDADLHDLLRSTRSTVVATHWEDTPAAVEAALRCGAHGALSKRLPRLELLAGIGDILRDADPTRCPPPRKACHPEIARAGLTQREVDVLCLVAEGLTNQEIAERLYLSINTVKTYIRYGYRKIGAERRSHAVVWVEQHGLGSADPSGSSVRATSLGERRRRREGGRALPPTGLTA